MLNSIFIFLIKTILDFLAANFLLRFYLQRIQAPYQNPLSHSVIAMTNFAIKPLRRIIPSLGKIDTSSLLAAFLSQLILYSTLAVSGNLPLISTFSKGAILLLFSLVGLVKISLYLVMIVLIVYVILGWVAPHNPISEVLNTMTKPMLKTVRKYVPQVNFLDLSPLIVGILAQIALIVMHHLVPLSL